MGTAGYSAGKYTSRIKQPFAYGVSDGPVINTCTINIRTIYF